jgi:CubicO group peptidase (beta-lactamase class C family)
LIFNPLNKYLINTSTRRRFRTIVILLFLLSSVTLVSQIETSRLGRELKALQATSNIPGFAVAIIKNDSVVFSKGYGYSNVSKKILFTAETVIPIASISKTFIGLALMKAVDQGYFTLETNINDILPFKVINPAYPKSIIRIKHLVTHTSGLIDNDSIYKLSYSASNRPSTELKVFLRSYYCPGGSRYTLSNFSDNEPGAQFSYSNIATALAAYLIEVKSKMPFYEYTARYIFEPLHMNDTHWFADTGRIPNTSLYQAPQNSDPVCQRLINADSTLKPYTNITYPDGQLFTNVKDLSTYLIAMIRGYSEGKGLLTNESFQTLFRKQFGENNTPEGLDPTEPNRAVFWIYDPRGRITHSGLNYGLTTFISFDPQTKIGQVLLFNTAFDRENNKDAMETSLNIFGQLNHFEDGLK